VVAITLVGVNLVNTVQPCEFATLARRRSPGTDAGAWPWSGSAGDVGSGPAPTIRRCWPTRTRSPHLGDDVTLRADTYDIDFEAVFAAMTPDIEWDESEGMPYGGVYHGPESVNLNEAPSSRNY
jgi:hypothetical protein